MSLALINPILNSAGFPTTLVLVERETADGRFVGQQVYHWNETENRYQTNSPGILFTITETGGDWIYALDGVPEKTLSASASPIGRYLPDSGPLRYDLQKHAVVLPREPEVTLAPVVPEAQQQEVTLTPVAPEAQEPEVTLTPIAPGGLIPEG